MPRFEDRQAAGRLLARRLDHYRGQEAVILGLPRGGVPVAAQVARALDLPLDVIVVRKLGFPSHPEVAMGALGEGGVRVLDDALVRRNGTRDVEVQEVENRERRTLDARSSKYRHGRERLDLTGRIAIIVDDGVATGATASAACQVARALGAQRVVLAVPVGPPGTQELFPEADEVVCLVMPDRFWAVGAHYEDFGQTTDEEVIALLDAAARGRGGADDPAG